MSDSHSPLIHIGFPKTGTTLLQGRIFARAELGFVSLSEGSRRIHRAFVQPGPLEEASPTELFQIQRECDDAEKLGLRLVISHERLSGYPASGGFDQGIIAERLYTAFPNGRVLIMIREQESMIYSMFLQTISDGSVLSLKRFLYPPDSRILRKPNFHSRFYQYDQLIRKYVDLFGLENVFVQPFEVIRSDQEGFFRRLMEFGSTRSADGIDSSQLFSSPVNEGRPLALQSLRRALNRVIRSQLSENGLVSVPTSHVERIFQKAIMPSRALNVLNPILEKPLRRRIAAYCDGLYGESNARTEELTGLNLQELGYQVANGTTESQPEDTTLNGFSAET